MNNDNIIIELEKNPELLRILFEIKANDVYYTYNYDINKLLFLKKLQLIDIMEFENGAKESVLLTDLGKSIKEQYQLKYFDKKLDLIEELQDYVKQKYNCRIESDIIAYSNVFSDNCVDATLTLYTNDNNIPIYTQHLGF